jgi:hypothetical protein
VLAPGGRIIAPMKRARGSRNRLVLVLVGVALGACGGSAPAHEETTPPARQAAEEPATENDAATEALVQQFADALRAYAVADGQGPVDAVFLERVAWRVHLTTILTMALQGIDPQQREAMAAEWSGELSQAGTEELARGYLDDRWARHARGGDCTIAELPLPAEPLFPSTASFAPDLRARLDADLGRAAELTALYEVTCGGEPFGVAVLRDRPELVPMM